MKVGLIARCDDRGLGHVTWEFHRNLQPDRTLVIQMDGIGGGFKQHTDRYPDGTVVPWAGGPLPEPEVRDWLQGLDVVYSAETFYDWQVCRWADELGVATVLHVMPEFYRHHAEPGLPGPTRWWAPTPWRMEHLPADTRLVPVPVALDVLAPQGSGLRLPIRDGEVHVEVDPPEGPLRVLHVAGHRAAADRNGTNLVLSALRLTNQPMTVTLATQDKRLPTGRPPRHVQLVSLLGGTDNYADLYRGHDVLVMPRRYGGLCLPAQEAMGAGLGVVLPDTAPNDWWTPAALVPCHRGQVLRTQGGPLTMMHTDVRALAQLLDRLAGDPSELAAMQVASWRWAMGHSWQGLGDLYLAQLADAAGLPGPL